MMLGAATLNVEHAAKAADEATATTGLEEIVVTARKRAENLMEVPISVQSFSAAELSAAGIFDLQTLKDSAGFTFQQTASTGAGGRTEGSIVFRGLQSTYGDVRENSGSLFVDGIFVSGGQASVNLIDIDHVEVLKGPQNTYFGRNTFGGAINFITKAPSDEFKGEVSASETNRGSTDDAITLQGPLVKGLLDGRITVFNHIKGAEYTASDGGALGAESSKGFDTSLNFTPSGATIRLNAHYQKDDDSAAAMGYLQGEASYGNTCVGHTFPGQNAAGAGVTFGLAQAYFCGSIPTYTALKTSGINVVDANTAIQPAYVPIGVGNSLHNAIQDKVPGLNHSGMARDLLRLSVLSEFALPYDATASFNIGYNQALTNVIWDVDRTSRQSFTSSETTVSEDLTVDARVTSDQKRAFRAMIGASYFTDLLQYQEDSLYGPGLVGTAFAFLSGFTSLSGYDNERSQVPAVYASVEYDILSNLTATAEARYQSDKNTDQPSQAYVPGGINSVSDTNKTTMPRFILRYKPVPGTMLYVSYAEGVQPTLLNGQWVGLSPAQKAYVANFNVTAYSQQPKLENIEFGIKQSLFDNRFEYALDFYHGLWEHQQTSTAVFGGPLPPTGTFLYLSNEATVKGFELSTKGLITDKWSASLNVQYVHSVWDNFTNATYAGFTVGGVDSFAGNELSRVPKWTGSFSTTYTDHLTGDWNWYVRGDANYTSSMWESDINIVKTDPYTRVNAVLGASKDSVSVELFAKNLFDDSHWDFAERVPNLATPNCCFTNEGLLVQAPDKREFGARVNVKF
jgi:iron complex outermembrane receptor protein